MAAKKSTAKKFPERFAKVLGKTTKLRRQLLKKTQAALAKEAGLSVKRLSAIENGKALPNKAEYAAIKKALKAASEEMFGKK